MNTEVVGRRKRITDAIEDRLAAADASFERISVLLNVETPPESVTARTNNHIRLLWLAIGAAFALFFMLVVFFAANLVGYSLRADVTADRVSSLGRKFEKLQDRMDDEHPPVRKKRKR